MLPLHEVGKASGRVMMPSMEYLASLGTKDPVRMPATVALEHSWGMPKREFKRARLGPSIKPQQNRSSFNMEDLVQAARPVQESVAFPLIEWNLDDEDDRSVTGDGQVESDDLSNDDEDSVDSTERPRFSSLGKRNRSCLGISNGNRLVRSKALNSHLFMLEDSIRTFSNAACCIPESSTPKSPSPCSFDVDKWMTELSDLSSKASSSNLAGSFLGS